LGLIIVEFVFREIAGNGGQADLHAQPLDLGDEFGPVADSEITGNDISRATVNPTSNGRAWDVQLGKEVPIPGLADGLFNSIVVGSPREW
jgi:hypothetical protein